MKLTIFTKLFFMYLLGSIAAFFIFSGSFYFLFQSDIKQEFIRNYISQREQVEQTLALAYQAGEHKDTVISTLNYINDREHRSIYLYDKSGNLLHEFSVLTEKIDIDESYIQAALQGANIHNFIKQGNRKVFLMAAPLGSSLTEYEEKVMVIGLHGYDKVATRIKGIFLFASIITIIVTTCFLYFISKRFATPLREMSDVAKEYAKGNFDRKVMVTTNDEIGYLGSTLNDMGRDLASLDSMRKEFVANVSHDMRSPLTSINGFIGAFIDGTIPKEDQKRYLQLMKGETERLIKLVNDLLDIARIEAGQVSINPTIYNVSEQVRMVIAKMEPQLMKQEVEVAIIGESDADLFTIADQDRIDQVLGNLIENAVNFSPRKGLVEVKLAKRENEVILSISDSGQGMNEQELKFIWERFYKVDKARSQKAGTGIGLSIVKHIIELHEAKVEVDSKLNKGTIFTITLPLVERKNILGE